MRAAKRGAGEVPVSVKTRIGYAKNELETWLPALLEEGLAEAEFLIPDLAISKKHSGGEPVYPAYRPKKPLGFFQSLFSRKPHEEEDDDFSNLPRNLK